MPLVYFHGDVSPGNNPDLYKFLVERVGGMLDARHGSNPAARASGVVVNTMGWVDGAGYKLLLHALDTLKITDVLVVGQERLHAELKKFADLDLEPLLPTMARPGNRAAASAAAGPSRSP